MQTSYLQILSLLTKEETHHTDSSSLSRQFMLLFITRIETNDILSETCNLFVLSFEFAFSDFNLAVAELWGKNADMSKILIILI